MIVEIYWFKLILYLEFDEDLEVAIKLEFCSYKIEKICVNPKKCLKKNLKDDAHPATY